MTSNDEAMRALLAPLAEVESVRRRARTSRVRSMVAIVAVAIVCGVGIAAAAGVRFGAFDGISGAQHPQTGADVLDARTLAGLRTACPSKSVQRFYISFCHLLLDSTRIVGHTQPYGNVYVITDTRDDLCTVFEGGAGSCGPPLRESQPTTFLAFNPSSTIGGTFVATGLALDGVTAVSFRVGGKAVTVPVENNVWMYSEANSHATSGQCIVAHLENGSLIRPFPEVQCP
jgi:hypothetical protein